MFFPKMSVTLCHETVEDVERERHLGTTYVGLISEAW